ncbi:MAG: hypothetical protein IB618_00160 [Candidatus Pacearchaeota archaeon]|nr:MAG: hypothetical protein IB618_00160 [Candidatus Pacearchaeota archaeon]
MIEEIFKISKSMGRAKALKEMAQERFSDVEKEKKTYKIIEQYYEVIKELITALMYLDGFKTLSHKALLFYLEKNYNRFFSKDEFILIDETRRLRNDILYYGKKIDLTFLTNNEERIKKITNKLIRIVNKKLPNI